MTEPSRDRWTTRDYPVLVAAADHLESTQGQPCHVNDLAHQLGMDEGEVISAVTALIPDYLTGDIQRANGGVILLARVIGLTSAGRRAAGLWPSQDDHLASLIAALQSAAEQTNDPEQRSTLRRVGDGLAAAPGNIAAGVLTAWLAAHGGI